MPAELYLARRYLMDRRHGAWGWLISWMATGSVAIGVAALITTLAVMTGFREDIREKILGVQPHVIITTMEGQLNPSAPDLLETLQSNKRILAWSPYISGQTLIGRGSFSSGALIKGINPEKEPNVVLLKQKIIEGRPSDLIPTGSEKPGILLGQELARNIGARVGDVIWISAPSDIKISAMTLPKLHLFRVVGKVQTGLYDYDSSMAYIDLSSAQKLFDMGTQVSGIGIRLEKPDSAVAFAKDLQGEFRGAYWVRSWLSLNQNLFSALKLEKTVMFIILTLVTLVASFMIVSNLLLIITQKIKEIGILRAMGATSNTIRMTFLYQGLLMGVVGNIIGVVLGVALSLILAKTNLVHLPADVYYVDKLPVRLVGMDILSVVLAAGVIVLTATLYPAHRASQLDPLDAIRYG